MLQITREFDATPEEVFEAFTTADALNEWWGPKEANTTVMSLDFKPGGIFLYKMDMGGMESYGRFRYLRIEKPELLEFIVSFCDEQANIVADPFGINLPREILNTVTLSNNNGKTILTFISQPVNAETEQVNMFNTIKPNMQEGFSGTFDQLDNYLDTRRK